MKMKILPILCFFVIAVVSVALRLYKINGPIADWHSWRQADTAAVARNFIRFGIDPLYPRYDDLSNIQSGKDNPMGYRMVEFPLYQMTAAYIGQLFPQVSIEVILRLLSIAITTATGILLGLLFYKRNVILGISIASVYAVIPYSIYYGRSILPDVPAVGLAVLSVYLFDCAFGGVSVKKRWIYIIFAALVASLAVLVKPVSGFLLLPVLGLLLATWKDIKVKIIQIALYAGIALIPFYFWRTWIAQFPEGIPVFTWLFNSNEIRFKGAWFYWLFAERIGKLILGYWGILLLGFGFIPKRVAKENDIPFWFLVGSLLYMSILATGNVQHDYYQIMILPTIAIFLGKGMTWVIQQKENRGVLWLLSLVSFSFMLSFSWYTVRTYYWVNRPTIVEAGKEADRLLPRDAKVIAPYNGDTTFLYQTGRQGWPLGFEIDKKIAMGATHYVTVSPTDDDLETRDLAKIYTVLVRNDRYAIIDLTKKNGEGGD